MKKFALLGGFGTLLSAINDALIGYREVSLSSDESNKDLDAILSNPEDRAKYNEALQKLKDNRLKKDGKKSEKVNFSDRTIIISIE